MVKRTKLENHTVKFVWETAGHVNGILRQPGDIFEIPTDSTEYEPLITNNYIQNMDE